MTVTYRTVVVHLPPTPLGLLPERWTIEHWCRRCRRRVMPEELVAHARDHERDEHTDGRRGAAPGQQEEVMSTLTPGPLVLPVGTPTSALDHCMDIHTP